MRNWTKAGKLTPVRPPPAGNPAGTGQNPSLNNPWGAKLAVGPGTAPNARPQPPDLLTQMTGLSPKTPASLPTAPAGKKKSPPTVKPRSGDELRMPKPRPDQLSPADRVNTVAHLAQTMAVSGSHAAVHSKATAEEASKKKPNLNRIRHNATHAAKHDDEMVEHGQKLADHLEAFPGAKSAAAELLQASPSKTAKPPPRGKK